MLRDAYVGGSGMFLFVCVAKGLTSIECCYLPSFFTESGFHSARHNSWKGYHYWMSACVCVCVRACVSACVRACVRACVCVFESVLHVCPRTGIKQPKIQPLCLQVPQWSTRRQWHTLKTSSAGSYVFFSLSLSNHSTRLRGA